MTADELEAAIRDAHYLLADHLPPIAFGKANRDLDESEERGHLTHIAMLAVEGSLSLLVVGGGSGADAGRDYLDWLIREAKAGSHLAHDALCSAAERLDSEGREVPPWLRQYWAATSRAWRQRQRCKSGARLLDHALGDGACGVDLGPRSGNLRGCGIDLGL